VLKVSLIPFSEFQRVRQAKIDRHEKLSIFADMCRFNTLCAVKRAGSGHLGSSFSAMDLVVWL
jgi:transketolase